MRKRPRHALNSTKSERDKIRYEWRKSKGIKERSITYGLLSEGEKKKVYERAYKSARIRSKIVVLLREDHLDLYDKLRARAVKVLEEDLKKVLSK